MWLALGRPRADFFHDWLQLDEEFVQAVTPPKPA
jgi:hypothetical protein